MRNRATALAVSGGLGILTTHVGADVIWYTDKNAWSDVVVGFETIGFAEVPNATFLIDEYRDVGVQFADGDDVTRCCGFFETYPEDGAGLDGNGNITLEFDVPQLWIAVDFPGLVRFELYSGEDLIYNSLVFGEGGIGNFAGLVSDAFFDRAVLIDDFAGQQASIDDLHFGVPGPAGLWLFGIAAAAPPRRRR